jgi:hypothetical protein
MHNLNIKRNGQFDRFSISPVNSVAEIGPSVFVEVLLDLWLLRSSSNSFDIGLNLIMNCFPLSCSLWTIVVIKSEHVIIRPSVHLDRENSGLIRECLKTHFIDPWLEVKTFHWGDSIVFLFLCDFIVVLAWWVKTKEHCLSTKNASIIPGGLNKNLSDVVKLIKVSTLLLFNIPVSQFIADHVLLSDAKRSHIVGILRLFLWIFSKAQKLSGRVRALSTNLINVFNLRVSSRNIVVGIV